MHDCPTLGRVPDRVREILQSGAESDIIFLMIMQENTIKIVEKSARMRLPMRRARSLLVVLIAVVGVLLAPPVAAQEGGGEETGETVEASEEQASLNDQGVRAIGNGDYVKAISLLEEALYLGELNITYLNLGRAYQKAGRCKKARETLQKVSSAPAVQRPSAGFIESKANQYLDELEEQCEFGDEQADAAEGDDTGDGDAEDDQALADKDAPDDAGPDDEDSSKDSVEPPPSTTSATGIALTGAGAVMILGATGMHFLWAQPTRNDVAGGVEPGDRVSDVSQEEYFQARDTANTIDTVALTTGIAGAAVAGIGVYFLLSDTGAERASTLRLSPSRDGMSATWMLRF